MMEAQIKGLANLASPFVLLPVPYFLCLTVLLKQPKFSLVWTYWLQMVCGNSTPDNALLCPDTMTSCALDGR